VGVRGVCEDLAVKLKAAGWSIVATWHEPKRLRLLIDLIATVCKNRSDYSVANVEVYSGRRFLLAEIVSQILRWLEKPYVLTLHGGNLPDFARRWPRRTSRLLCSAAAVTAPSRYLQEKMSSYRSGIRLLPNPIDLRLYPFRLRERPAPSLIWIRSFQSEYNPLLAPKVVTCLTKEFPGVSLAMIGADSGDGTLDATRRVTKLLEIQNRTTLQGAVKKTDIPMRLSPMDIFINTANFDNTPVTVLEAMACGLCIVSTNVGGIPYLLTHDHDALLVPPEDPSAMAGAVRRLLLEPGLAERLSRNARKHAEKYDWSEILPEWERLLSSVAEKRLS
jgi:glycosyltransferase involved in cell wall biosynthesis